MVEIVPRCSLPELQFMASDRQTVQPALVRRLHAPQTSSASIAIHHCHHLRREQHYAKMSIIARCNTLNQLEVL